jgi:hypothetical protein
MSQPELLKRVVRVLNDAGVSYMLTGSFASSAQGEPRSSHDIDLVVTLTEADAQKKCRCFSVARILYFHRCGIGCGSPCVHV